MHNRPDNGDGVAALYFLSLGVGAAVIADRHLVTLHQLKDSAFESSVSRNTIGTVNNVTFYISTNPLIKHISTLTYFTLLRARETHVVHNY